MFMTAIRLDCILNPTVVGHQLLQVFSHHILLSIIGSDNSEHSLQNPDIVCPSVRVQLQNALDIATVLHQINE